MDTIELEKTYADLAEKTTKAAKKVSPVELAAITRGQKPMTKDGETFLALKTQKGEAFAALSAAKEGV